MFFCVRTTNLNWKVLGDSNEIRAHNHLVCKRTLNHLAKLAKWLSVFLRIKWLQVRIALLSESRITFTFRYRLCEEFLDIQATIDCIFTLKGVCEMIITQSWKFYSKNLITFQRQELIPQYTLWTQGHALSVVNDVERQFPQKHCNVTVVFNLKYRKFSHIKFPKILKIGKIQYSTQIIYFQSQGFHLLFMILQSIDFKWFAIVEVNYVFVVQVVLALTI